MGKNSKSYIGATDARPPPYNRTLKYAIKTNT